jgi:hypothetical protein
MELTINVHHFIHPDPTGPTLADVLAAVADLKLTVTKQGDIMTGEYDRLAADVQSMTDLVPSIEATISGLAQQLKDALAAGATPAQLSALADQMEAAKTRLAAAAVAGTPAAPAA